MPSSPQPSTDRSDQPRRRGWKAYFQSQELPNEGSTARDHLALERTFLAYLRTSLSLVTFGIAIAQFFRLPAALSQGSDDIAGEHLSSTVQGGLSRTPSFFGLLFGNDHGGDDDNQVPRGVLRLGKPVGVAYIALGIMILVFGAMRYFSVQADLMRTGYTPSTIEGG